MLVSVEYPPRPGGIGVSCRRLATGLRDTGNQVVVVACDDNSETAANCDEARVTIQDGIPVHWLPPSFTRGEGFVWAMHHLLPLVQSFRPSLVHSYTPIPAGYLGVRCAAYANVPHIVSNRGADVTQFSLMWPTGTKLVYENSDAILSVSSSFHKYIELVSGRTDGEFIANSISPDIYESEVISTRAARQALSIPEDTPTLGTISKFRWKKGLDYLEEVLGRLGKSHLEELQFILGGIYESELSNRLKSAFESGSSKTRCRRMITFPEPERQHVSLLMSAMDLFVSTSAREGMPNTLIESVACGTPIAATAVDGQVDLLKGFDVGVLLHRFDPRIGAEQISDVIRDRERLDKMSSQCRPFVENNHLQKHEVKATQSVYQRVIAKSRLKSNRPTKTVAA